MPHEAVVTSTKSVRHYGVSANAVYKETEDAGQPKVWDAYEQIHRVSKMTWYISYVSLLSYLTDVNLNALHAGRRPRAG